MSERSEVALDASAPVAPGESIWGAVREALRGSQRNYTEGPIGRAVLILAIPMVLEMVMESVFVVCDVFFVSRLGPDAVATVGLTESMLAIIYTIAMGLSIGVTATVARRTGEKDTEGAARTAVQAIALGLLVSAILGIAGAIFAPSLLSLMGASESVIATGSTFTRVMLGGNASVLLLFLVNAIFRGAGDPQLSMRTLWLANAINIALAPCLIFGVGPFPELGVTGAAIATTTGRSIGVLFGFGQFLRQTGRIRLHRRHLRLDPGLMARLVKLSGTGTFQVLISTASWIVLVRILATFGSEALAGYTIAVRVVLFALLPSWGLSNAAATMVGQALGARKPERAEKAVWMAGFYNVCFLGAVGLLFFFGAHPIVALFTHDPAVGEFARDALRMLALGFALYAYGMVLSQAFNGAGDTWTPTLLNLIAFWLFEIPLAYALAVVFGVGPHGAFIAIASAFSVFAVMAIAMFRRGTWKTKTV
ncbi:MAG TPA: MATE family efflux transporter [Gemmatimonadaceae bacterium]|jgi:putative MATE family efflux protein|nr:MATE family efflux transporter [Gemmatimonadaceae bacterium]